MEDLHSQVGPEGKTPFSVPDTKFEPTEEGLHKGLVVESTGIWTQVKLVDDNNTVSNIVSSRLPGRQRLEDSDYAHPIAVGDWVKVSLEDDDSGIIQYIYPRKNGLPRQSTHTRRQSQLLLANLDFLWLVQSARQPRVNTRFIDRCLVACEAYDIPVGLIINKLDLARRTDKEHLQRVIDIYAEIDVPTYTCSVLHEDGLEPIQAQMGGKVSAFFGPSGVGKSSLLNAVDPTLELNTAPISSSTGKGTHTTTYAVMVEPQGYPEGTMIADTPGIRELGLVGIPVEELSHYFSEMTEHRSRCKYSDCSHLHEPGCGVQEAVKRGKITQERYDSYQAIYDTLKVPEEY
ncbi:MAG: ribosome small subunit-dependent GTPase A [Balneolaceae bacterium]|nr:ribosome small subunit-dependent GTPase A [Balneolaceae bacterium]MDR9447097.1 ribosome small subunit-dependent GTPase A [Balneolaceae bacterium]